jgi:hypothetical protein
LISKLAKQLQQLQYEVDVKPSSDTVESMVKLIETAFKRQLGENVVGTSESYSLNLKRFPYDSCMGPFVGLKLTVGQVLRAVQQKANKEEVMSIISTR